MDRIVYNFSVWYIQGMHLPSPSELSKELPLTPEAAAFVSTSRKSIQSIIDGKDSRLLIVVGPCSIHNTEEALIYAEEIKKLAEEVKEHCFLVMRTYIEKPRTRKGWRGLVHDPHLNGSEVIANGLPLCRSLLCRLAEMQVPTATEFLTPQLTPYFADTISWGCIGARTSSSQIHRLLASHLPMPVGFKNTVDGNVECAVNGVLVARSPHTFVHTCKDGKICKVQSQGNPYCHVVLRGSSLSQNYDAASIQRTLAVLRMQELSPRVLIDCSHGNAKGKYYAQKEVFHSVLEQKQEGNSHILGMMLESNLEAGSQLVGTDLHELQRGMSVTDGCIDFPATAELIKSVSSSSILMSLTHN